MSDLGWALGSDKKILPRDPNISGLPGDRSCDEHGPIRGVAQASTLVSAAQAGDRDAFGLLYREHYGAVYRLARFYLGASAEDVVAETFLRAWKALPRYRDTGAPFVSWLYGIARHVVADELRKAKRLEPRDTLPEIAFEGSEDDRLVLAAALERLPKEQRRVIEMKYLLGLKNPEVAEALGKSVGAVNAMQWRALATLRDLMEEEL